MTVALCSFHRKWLSAGVLLCRAGGGTGRGW